MARMMARGKSFAGSRVSRAWNPDISTPQKTRITVAANGSVDVSKSGSRADGVNGTADASPLAIDTMSSTIIRAEGMMTPITPPQVLIGAL